MKKYIAIIFAVVMAAIMVLPCAATETVTEMPTEAITEAVSESVAVTEATAEEVTTVVTESEIITDAIADVVTESVETDVVTEIEISIDIGEVHDIIENSSSFAEAVIAIADRFGISIEDAEKLVGDMKALGDKYLGESEVWEIVKHDMENNPGKYVVVALIVLVLVAIIGLMLKWIVSNIGQIRALKIDLRSLKKSVDGDDSDEGKANSLRYLISAKNGRIEALERENAEIKSELVLLCERDEELTLMASEVKKNTESALNITQETALQIAQLLCIAMDNGKLPLMSKEAKQIWLANTQARIKAAGAVKDAEGGEADAEASKEVQNV